MRRTVLPLLAAALVGLLSDGCSRRGDRATVSSPDIVTIGHGGEVILEDHLLAGKTTVVSFYSEYCPGCVLLDPELESLAAQRDDVALVKVDINRPSVRDTIDFDSPVARQFELESLPYLILFGRDGHTRAKGKEALALVGDWLEGLTLKEDPRREVDH